MMQKKTVLLRSFENTSYAPVNRVDCGFRHSIHPPPTFAVLPQPPRTPAKNITIFRTENLTFPPTMTDTRERGADRQNRNRTEKQRRRGAKRSNPASHYLYLYPVSYTHLRAHETPEHLVCRLLLEKK